jgi:hypothetical protein
VTSPSSSPRSSRPASPPRSAASIFRLALEQYPALYVVPQRTRPGVRRVDVEPDGAISVQITYSVRVYAMVRGDDEHQADDLRSSYVEAVRAVVFGGLAIGSAGAAQVSTATYAEDYSAVTPDVSGALAGAYHEFDVTVLELVEPEEEPAGTADEIEVTTEPIGRLIHPSHL